jgi:hypothetical protein
VFFFQKRRQNLPLPMKQSFSESRKEVLEARTSRRHMADPYGCFGEILRWWKDKEEMWKRGRGVYIDWEGDEIVTCTNLWVQKARKRVSCWKAQEREALHTLLS